MARAQHGRISTAQMAQLGWSKEVVAARVRSGWLVREYRGVYRLAGAPSTPTARGAAAVLATEPLAVLTARVGLELQGVLEPLEGPAVHVVCTRHVRPRDGLVVHRRPVPGDQVVRVDGLRVASVARCLVDLAASAAEPAIADAVHEAEFHRVLDPGALVRAAVGRRNAPLLRRLAAERLPIAGPLRLELERRFARFLRRYGFPPAETNRRTVLRDPWQVVLLDAVWLAAGIAVELDGRQAHATSRAFDADRERDRRLAVQHDLHVVRVTWKHLHEDPDGLARDLWTLLRRGLDTARPA